MITSRRFKLPCDPPWTIDVKTDVGELRGDIRGVHFRSGADQLLKVVSS
jgi:hypothetical protein